MFIWHPGYNFWLQNKTGTLVWEAIDLYYSDFWIPAGTTF